MRELFYKESVFKIVGDERDPYFLNVGLDPFYSKILGYLPEDAIVFDIGGNIGVTSLMAASHNASVYAFEPSPKAFKWLTKNIANNPDFKVFPENVAVGAKNGHIGFFDNPHSASASHLSADQTLGHEANIHVPVITIDDFVNEHTINRVDLIKIDVEGFEPDVLKGCTKTIERFKLACFVEFNSFTMISFRNINPRDMLSDIRETFPFVYEYRDGRLNQIKSDDEALGFIHDNLVVHGCVSDLYCCFDEILDR